MTDVESAEMIKYASNAFLAVKIGFMNEIANLCDQVGADVHVVAKGMGLDKRIGSKFLHPGPGYGGSCFPEGHARAGGARHAARGPQHIVEAAIEVNLSAAPVARREDHPPCYGVGAAQHVAVLGLAFKPNTDDVREAPALYVCRELARAGAGSARSIRWPDARRPSRWPTCATGSRLRDRRLRRAARWRDALVIMTEWNEFRGTRPGACCAPAMARPLLVDARNVLDPVQTRAMGFEYLCTGRQSLAPLGVPA